MPHGRHRCGGREGDRRWTATVGDAAWTDAKGDDRIRTGGEQLCRVEVWQPPPVQNVRPPAAVATERMKAISAQKSTWWCARRFWADQVLAHPSLALACRALQAARGLPWSRTVLPGGGLLMQAPAGETVAEAFGPAAAEG